VLKSCAGGCLIIDESYSLFIDEKDWFGIECLNTINLFLSTYPDEIIVVFLGYEEPTKRMLEVNQGLGRRIGFTFTIGEYSTEELVKIFLKQCHDFSWSCEAGEKELTDLFSLNKDSLRNQGGDTLRLLAQAKVVYAKQNWKEHANYVMSSSMNSLQDYPNTPAPSPKLSSNMNEEDELEDSTLVIHGEIDKQGNFVLNLPSLSNLGLSKVKDLDEIDEDENDKKDDGQEEIFALDEEISKHTSKTTKIDQPPKLEDIKQFKEKVLTLKMLEEAFKRHRVIVQKSRNKHEIDNDPNASWKRIYN
jgi:hypothetical protein